MNSEVIVIGAGISGLSAAALLAKRKINVTLIEANAVPGGSCGIFKRGEAVFDQGSSMLYGFGENGFNSHRFLFNCLNEPIEVIKHDLLYTIVFMGKRIRFYSDTELFIEELSEVFPTQRKNIKRFYHDITAMYEKVIAENPCYTTPDEIDPRTAFSGMMRHPIYYLKFLSYMNKSASWLLKKYFDDPLILNFFDKLTSTYCYATLSEAPAIMASVMFADNHIGGSYYPAGSTLFLAGKLEKVIEENGGTILYNSVCERIITENGEAAGVKLKDGRILKADEIIYSGNVWDLYAKLLRYDDNAKEERKKAKRMLPTFPSIVLYLHVREDAINKETCPIEMLIADPQKIDENEITVYIPSIDDKTIAPKGTHVIEAIGPSQLKWAEYGSNAYIKQKQTQTERVLKILEKRFPNIRESIIHAELASPYTIERFTLKPNGAVAGPKQMIGQHMFLRQHTKTYMPSLFCCGESTVMGTGTPTVTVSAIAAANAVLKKRGLEMFSAKNNIKEYVRLIPAPFYGIPYEKDYTKSENELMKKARRCRYCLFPKCCIGKGSFVPDITRRISVGNFIGALKIINKEKEIYTDTDFLKCCENKCIIKSEGGEAVDLSAIVNMLFKCLTI